MSARRQDDPTRLNAAHVSATVPASLCAYSAMWGDCDGRAHASDLFVTCLVDLIRPSVGFAAVKLLEDAGCAVEVPRQACCGQPAFNSGDRADTRAIADR